ncbi:MAG TPA: peptidylprolyl isomerase [Candidatus Moranbacteria bacterium]|nr:peptidylprolyl isomerase [Candidatus Moranbacteria bacterium]
MSKNIKKNKEDKKEIQDKKVGILTIMYAVGTFLAVYIIFAAVAIYIFNADNILIQKTVKIIPYPAAFCNSKIVRISELDSKTESVKKFYENQDFSDLGMRVDFNTEDGQKRLKIKEKYVLNKMIENLIIEKEAKKREIVLTDDIVSQEVDRKIREYGNENDLRENMSRLYGWDIEDFKKNIVKPDLYKEKLTENIRKNEPVFQKAKEKISKAAQDLENKKEFFQVAEKYSEGDSAKNKGALGWFELSQMLPEIAQTVVSLEKGQTSDIMESSIGYHIIKIEDRKSENDKELFKISQIFVRTKNFGEYLAEWEKEARIYVLLKDYHWSKESLMVEFNNAELEGFEKKLRENSPDDVSVMF